MREAFIGPVNGWAGGLGPLAGLTKSCDVTLSLEAGEADVPTRANAGWRATVATLKEASVEFEMVWDTADAGFTAITNAYLNNEVIGFQVLDGATGQGLQGDFMITSFSRSEPLEEAITVSVTAKVTYSAAPQPPPPPVLLVTHRSVVPSPGEAAAGLSAQFLSDQARPRWRPPDGAGTFFGAYFFVTYAHGIHVVAGVLLAATLLVMAVRGRLAPARCAPVALGSAVWCWGAAMWLLTYPAVFLLR